jgi:hypothetical protein
MSHDTDFNRPQDLAGIESQSSMDDVSRNPAIASFSQQPVQSWADMGHQILSDVAELSDMSVSHTYSMSSEFIPPLSSVWMEADNRSGFGSGHHISGACHGRSLSEQNVNFVGMMPSQQPVVTATFDSQIAAFIAEHQGGGRRPVADELLLGPANSTSVNSIFHDLASLKQVCCNLLLVIAFLL